MKYTQSEIEALSLLENAGIFTVTNTSRIREAYKLTELT